MQTLRDTALLLALILVVLSVRVDPAPPTPVVGAGVAPTPVIHPVAAGTSEPAACPADLPVDVEIDELSGPRLRC